MNNWRHTQSNMSKITLGKVLVMFLPYLLYTVKRIHILDVFRYKISAQLNQKSWLLTLRWFFFKFEKNIYSIVKWLNIIYDFLTEVTINVVPYPVLTVASWPAYKFIKRQVKCWYSHLFQNFPQFIMAHTVKGFDIINKAEIHVLFWNSLAFSMIQWMLAIWSLVPLPFLNPAWSSGSSRFTNCWSLAWRILSFTLLVCEKGGQWHIS